MTKAPLPLVPTKEMTLYQRQRCGQRFWKETLKATNPLLKGTGWKRNSAWVFRVEGDWYLTAFVTGGTTSDRMANVLKVAMGIKPMAVDPIHWRAQGLHGNLAKPPSFRSNAAHKVPALPIAQRDLSVGLSDPQVAAGLVVAAINVLADEARAAVADQPFSQVVMAHPRADCWSALYWAALIAEGRGAQAIEAIKAHYLKGEHEMPKEGRLFDMVADYQAVIDGTDSPAKRALIANLDGIQIVDTGSATPLAPQNDRLIDKIKKLWP